MLILSQTQSCRFPHRPVSQPAPTFGGKRALHNASGSERGPGFRRRQHLAVSIRLDIAGNAAAAFDLDLAIADRARHPPGGTDQQPVADGQTALEAAPYLDLVDRRRALEQ